MASPLKLLLVEDNPSDALLVTRQLHLAGYAPDTVRVETEAEFLFQLSREFDLVISDYQLPQFNGLRALELLGHSGLTLPFILVSGTIGEDTAVAAMRQGASDYLLKDRLARLGSAVQRALEKSHLQRAERAAATALILAVDKYRSIFENSSEGIYQTTDDGRLITANPALARIAGYASPAAMIEGAETTVTEFYADAADREKFRATMKAQGYVENFEVRMKTRDGRACWVRTNARTVHSAGGTTFYEGMIQDITAAKQAELELRKSESRFRTTLDSLMEGCQIVDHEWRYLYVNASAARHARRNAAELIGRKMPEAFPGIENTPMFDTLRTCLADGLPRQIENEFAYDDGTSGSFQLVIQPVPEGLFVLSLDITTRKKAEAEIKGQLDELRRWQEVILNREDRMQALKAEVNTLLAQLGQPARYSPASP